MTMNDNKIIKFLKYCSKSTCCYNCNFEPRKSLKKTLGCALELMENAHDLITRQQAELEQLKERIKSYEQFDEFKARIRVDGMIVCADSLSEWLDFCDKLKSEAAKEVVERTVDYLIANGVILPPCKVGDTVYTYERRRIKKWVITFCGKNSRGEYKMIAADDGFKNMLEFWDYDIGETVFLTREEAENAIERSNGNA